MAVLFFVLLYFCCFCVGYVKPGTAFTFEFGRLPLGRLCPTQASAWAASFGTFGTFRTFESYRS